MPDTVWITKDINGSISGVFANPQIAIDVVPVPADDPAVVAYLSPPAVTSVTPRQARLALLQYGLLDQVEALVAQVGGSTKITWEYALEIRRDDPFIVSLGPSLNMASEHLDALFRVASTL